MWRSRLVTGPAVEPVTLAEAKQHIRLQHTADDNLITSLITSARWHAEAKLSQSLVFQTWDLIFDIWPWAQLPRYGGVVEALYIPPSTRQTIRILNPPLSSVVSITYTDTQGVSQVLDPTLYRVLVGTPGEIVPIFGHTWPVTRLEVEAITVRYVSGYSADASLVPEPVRQWIMLCVGTAYEMREETVTGGTLSHLEYADSLLASVSNGFYQ